ncbi:hypothetical protein GUITHDRAFT_147098 [Guillardia theta CCMP2712]|uniref:Uncharacterized protein n=1 Tax=Guillardia theta (strain CCMP2712) TaxID=905079 RepID=L1IFE0_GUITC|nr:hypothetical protein GUITHDRAFT_147098 [Guillardia theta CCMP2712]EKX34575.1 hypothetical protein GUITHDRAFT_147098 [Guillardia theta CCMP2712]|eukprot:XP_005821555.1 hypothetical protein GUITHDRAFT_147098 [Guillardia theta CCMP2712]
MTSLHPNSSCLPSLRTSELRRMASDYSERLSYDVLLKERDDLQREASTAHAELYAVLKQSDYRSADELALDCMARMAVEASQIGELIGGEVEVGGGEAPIPDLPTEYDEIRVKKRVEKRWRRNGERDEEWTEGVGGRGGQRVLEDEEDEDEDENYEYDKLTQATTQLRQVEKEIEGKEWTMKMVSELTKTLLDLKESLMGTQNKAAEIEVGSALHKHVVSAVQNAEVLEGTTDTAKSDRARMYEAFLLCLKTVGERRAEMMQDDIGHGDIESWIAKWEDRMARDAEDVMSAAQSLDDTMKVEVEVQMRNEREIDSVEVMVDGKEQFIRKMNDVRNRTLTERDALQMDQKRNDQVRSNLDNMFHQKHNSSEQKLMEIRTRKGECRDRIEHYREELVRIMNCIKAEHASISALSSFENEIIQIQQENARVKALIAKDLTAKIRAVELALARGCNILDSVMTRKHERETELDSKCREMFIQHHEANSRMYRYLYQVLCDKEDKREQLQETMETHKYHFEQIANFSEIGRVKDLMKRVDADLARVNSEIQQTSSQLIQRYKALWDLERVLYQRFRFSEGTSQEEEINFDALQEQAMNSSGNFSSTLTLQPRPKALDPFIVLRFDTNILRNSQFTEGRQGWTANDSTELALREAADHTPCCAARAPPKGQGILLQQRDVHVHPDREYLLRSRPSSS